MKSRSWFTAGKMVKILSIVWFVAIALSYPTVHIMVRTCFSRTHVICCEHNRLIEIHASLAQKKQRKENNRTLIMVHICWLIILLFLLMCCFLYQDTTIGLYYNNETSVILQTCSDSNYGHQTHKILFAWYQLLVMFILPTIIIVYCYAVVICVLWLSTKELAKMTQADW